MELLRQLKRFFWVAFAVLSIFVLGFYIGIHSGENVYYYNAQGKLDKMLHIVQQRYVDSVSVDTLEKNAIQNILEQLDPHSYYLEPSTMQASEEVLRGEFYGIGIQYAILQDTLVAVSILPDGPAKMAGLLRGDRILKADTTLITGKWLQVDSVKTLLKGKKGTRVQLSIFRKSNGETLPISVVRGEVQIPTLSSAFMYDKQTGYLRLNAFGDRTYQEFMQAVQDLQAEGAKQFIIDLRDNGGGLLRAVLSMLDEILPVGSLLLYTEGKHNPRREYYADKQGKLENVPLVVMMNQNSASASEILAGALQDYDRGVVVGRRSFGKGLVQESFDFSDGSGLRLTTARYFTPSGRSIQKPYHKKDDAWARYERGEFFLADSMLKNDSLVYKTKAGRKVYGAGGILPDVFIALDTTLGYGKSWQALQQKRLLGDFAFALAEREKFAFSFKNLQDFENNFIVQESVWQDLIKYAQKHDISLLKINDKEQKEIKLWLKAYLGSYIYPNTYIFEKILAKEDTWIQKATETFLDYDKILESVKE
jgi:carboxyl-terminal processing protease